ncbi:glycosyltransferase family 4 protein [Parafrankia sp. FMc2]|uniref:glycosyltransferase family 4 protein n=1 Tax=Parafrankia sp. FMc2 TaxID=3233196 RepID=UPI0034D42014
MLLLAPSEGLGGGIERYLSTIEDFLRYGGADVHRVDMVRPGRTLNAACRSGFAARALRIGRSLDRVDCVVAGHRNLIPLAAAVAGVTGARLAPVLFYGNDIWELGLIHRNLLARTPSLFPLTISSYSAGALSTVGIAPILPPGIAPAWRSTLIEEGRNRAPSARIPTVLSVFRLPAWEGKGLPVLVDALAAVRREIGPVRLVVAGHGPAPNALKDFASSQPGLEIYENPDDQMLARLYATADLFTLCTRIVRPNIGEGYGIVLLEAQLTGCPVVGPASGGSYDAYQEGITGVTPASESADALADTLLDLFADRNRLAQMGGRAVEWAAAVTDPDAYLRKVFSLLTGTRPAVAEFPRIPQQRTYPKARAGAPVRS